MNCLTCKTTTKNPKYCSRKCSASTNNKISIKRKRTKLCKYCPNLILSSRTRCVNCHNQIEEGRKPNGSIGEYRNSITLKGKHRSWLHSQVRNLNRSWNKELRKLPCAVCGYAKHVELAHIKAVASFSDTALLSEVNARENVIQLCPNCHWEFDNGLIEVPPTGYDPVRRV